MTSIFCIFGLFFLGFTQGLSTFSYGKCDVAVVGAGPGGVYTAWRLAQNGDDPGKICLIERLHRVGGRILSLRHQGPENDLTVDLGAYRFPESPMLAYGYYLYAPLTASLVEKELKLSTAPYEPGTNSTMRKIVDDEGQNIGYATFVEAMYAELKSNGIQEYFGTEITSIKKAGKNLQLIAKDGSKITAKNVVLNLPLRPLTRVLANSDSLFPEEYPLVLSEVRPTSGIKLYAHYSDAWWRNYLNLTFGDFKFNSSGPHEPPLQGRYHDGHIRKSASGSWRGFIEAVYAVSDPSYDFFGPLQTSEFEPYVKLESENPPTRALLMGVHRQLVAAHRSKLEDAGVFEKVLSSPPSFALMSAWGPHAAGFGGAVHYTLTNGSSINTVPARAMQPKEGLPLFVANEAFGSLRNQDGTNAMEHGWAECSLVMAENILSKHFNLKRPDFIDASTYEKYVLFA